MPAIPALIAAGGSMLAAKQQGDAAGGAANTQAKGVAAAQQMQRDFTNRALNYIQPTFQNARNALQQGQMQGGLLLDEAGNVLSRGYDQARGDVTTGFMGAEQLYQPAYQTGQMSAYKQAALNGLLGADAQRQAYSEFQSSPGTQWLQSRQQQAILNNAAALGGGLANQTGVQQALQENALGGALQDYGNYYNRLSGFTDRGDAATGAISGIRQNLGQILANLSTSKAGDVAGIYGQQANLATGTQQGIGQLFANEGITAGNILTGAGSEQAQLAQNLGVAQSGGQLYAAQNAPAWAQGLQSGLGTYTGLGGTFGRGGANMGATNASADYTGKAYQDWLAAQRG